MKLLVDEGAVRADLVRDDGIFPIASLTGSRDPGASPSTQCPAAEVTQAADLRQHRSAQAVKRKRHLKQAKMACTWFRRHRVRCFDGTGGESWKGGSLHASSSLRRCG